MLERELRLGQCSYYVTNKGMKNEVITLEQFVNAIRSDRWKDKVQQFRELMERGDKKGARFIKDLLPCLVVAGVCSGGHSKANFRMFSGYLMVDVDHYPGDIRALLQMLQAHPWAYAGWITISGEGLKLVVRVDARTQEEYEEQAYPIVAAHIRRLIDFSVDIAVWRPDPYLLCLVRCRCILQDRRVRGVSLAGRGGAGGGRRTVEVEIEVQVC